MSANLSAWGTDLTRPGVGRFPSGLESTGTSPAGHGEKGWQASLFEQILSLPAPLETQFASDSTSPELPPADSKFNHRESQFSDDEAEDRREIQDETNRESELSPSDKAQAAAEPDAMVLLNPAVPEIEDQPQGEAGQEGSSPIEFDLAVARISAVDRATAEDSTHAAAWELRQLDATVVAESDQATQEDVTAATLLHPTEADPVSAGVEGEAHSPAQNPDGQLDASPLAAKSTQAAPPDASQASASASLQAATTVANEQPASQPSADGRSERQRARGRDKWYQRDAAENSKISSRTTSEDAAHSEVRKADTVASAASRMVDSSAQDPPVETHDPSTAMPAGDEPGMPSRDGPTDVSPPKSPQALTAVTDQLATAGGAAGEANRGGGPREISGPTAVGSLSRSNDAVNAMASESKQPKLAAETLDLTQQERARLVQRVARSFTRFGPEGGQIHLRLHPPQLGSLNVQVRLEGRSMTANLTTENGAAREAILESLPVLRSRLAEQGYEISQFTVEVADNGSDAAQSGTSERDFQQDRSPPETRYDWRRAQRQAQVSSQPEPWGRSPSVETLTWQTMAGIDVQA